jgi:hypothetical protein
MFCVCDAVTVTSTVTYTVNVTDLWNMQTSGVKKWCLWDNGGCEGQCPGSSWVGAGLQPGRLQVLAPVITSILSVSLGPWVSSVRHLQGLRWGEDAVSQHWEFLIQWCPRGHFSHSQAMLRGAATETALQTQGQILSIIFQRF